MHQDIDRCISRHPMLEEIVEEDAFTPLTDEEWNAEEDQELNTKARQRLRQWDIDARARQLQALRSFNMPPDDTSGVFSDEEEVDDDPRYLIDQLASVGDNISITGQYKSGKTLFVCNLVRCIADGEMFLDQFEIDELLHRSITVGFWSCEMTRRVLVGRYLNPQEFTEDGKERVHLWHGRGYGINLMDEVAGKEWAVKWLKSRDISVWVVDSFARLCAMAGIDPNDNDQVLKLLRVIDEIKHEAGVSELFLIAHIGRGELAKERARGATVFDDWADARWVLTREADIRFLKVEGRDVELPPTSLKYDSDTKRLTVGGGREDIVGANVQAIFAIVMEHEGVNKTALIKLIRERRIPGLTDQNVISEMIDEGVELGWMTKKKTGKGRELAFYPVRDGRIVGSTASIRTLDFTGVKEYQSKRRS